MTTEANGCRFRHGQREVVHEEHTSDKQFRARFRREIRAARRVGEEFTAPVLEADIVHRGLKPSNVMLTVDGPRVIDLGIARAVQTSVESLLTSTGMAIGSPGFMAPEQVLAEEAGPRADVFALGCVLTYAATGRLAFGHGASNQHALMYRMYWIVEAEPELDLVSDASLRALIARCLTKKVDERPDVAELLADPARPRPAPRRGAWLPGEVVAELAQQSARLLDVEAPTPAAGKPPQPRHRHGGHAPLQRRVRGHGPLLPRRRRAIRHEVLQEQGLHPGQPGLDLHPRQLPPSSHELYD